MLNGLEKTLERKMPQKDRRWQVEEDSSEYLTDNESLPAGWPSLIDS
jgi:hypothetical protein